MAFRHFFSKSFISATKNLKDLAVDEPENDPDRRPNKQRLASLCALWLVTRAPNEANFPSPEADALCMAAKLYSPNDKVDPAGVTIPGLTINELITELNGKQFMDRVCAYHNYMRAQRLAELLEEMPHPGPSPGPSPDPSFIAQPDPTRANHHDLVMRLWRQSF